MSVIFVDLSLTRSRSTADTWGEEEVHDRVGAALARVVGHLEAFGGTVTSVSGAGLVALFGAPVSHEDDPERALRAAFLAIRAADTGRGDASLRAGVETGPAVVGCLPGSGAHYNVFGEVVNAAAALQAFAKPGSVLVGPATQTATEALFDWGPTEEVATSTGAKPVVARYLERPKARPFAQVGRRPLAVPVPLVGRETEVGLLKQAVREETAGSGSVVVITGEPGLGKTRLVAECRKLFMAWVGARSGRLPLWLEGRAASYASSKPYGLYQQMLCAWIGAAPEEDEETVRGALGRALSAVTARQVDDLQLALLCLVIGLAPGEGGFAISKLTPEQLQRAIFGALRDLFGRLISYGPTVLVLEDLHWADPTSLRLTDELSSLTREGPLLLVLTRRPEPDPGVSALEAALGTAPELSLRRLELSSLPQGAERGLARALLGQGAPDEVVDAVRQGAEGNPFFLEQRLSSLLETEALVRGEGGGWFLERAAPDRLPEAIERLVRARVNRLGPGPHDAIVAASVLGPEFAFGALGTVTDLDDRLLPAVSDLCSGGLFGRAAHASRAALPFSPCPDTGSHLQGPFTTAAPAPACPRRLGPGRSLGGTAGRGRRRARPPLRHGRRGRPGRPLLGAGGRPCRHGICQRRGHLVVPVQPGSVERGQ